MLKILSLAVLIVLSGHPTAQAGWFDKIKDVITPFQDKALSDSSIGKGLREALSIGIDKAVASASSEGGFYKNEAIKIDFPENLAVIEKGLRGIGLGDKVDAFEKSVNRAAEKAAPEAKEILLDALFDMTIEDASTLLQGGDMAATDYFRAKSWDRLYKAFQPKIDETMSKYQASQIYNQLIESYQKIPFAQKPQLVGADEYATNKALEGLFHLVGEQEKLIRTDPQARVTSLLQKVFGDSEKK